MIDISIRIIIFQKFILYCVFLFICTVSAAAPPTKPRGRPPKLNQTVVSDALNAVDDLLLSKPVKRTYRSTSG